MKFFESQSTLVEEIDSNLENLAKKWTQFLRIQDPISTEVPGVSVELSRTRTWKEMLFLTMVHHYLEDEELRWQVKDCLYSRSNKFGSEKEELLTEILLLSRAEMILYLLETSLLFANPRELFGFLGVMAPTIGKYLLYLSYPRKPQKTTRIRGYRDHGSRKPDHKWTETHDWTLDRQQEEIERKRKITKDTIQFIRGGTS